MDRREVISPYNDVFVAMVVKILTGYSDCCQFCLKDSAVVGDLVRVLVNNRVVVIRCYNKANASALIGAGAVCIT